MRHAYLGLLLASLVLSITPTSLAVLPYAKHVKPIPTYPQHVGEDLATFDAIRRELSADDQKTRDLIRSAELRINHNDERISNLQAQMQALHEWRASVSRGLWELLLLILGALGTLFWNAFRLQQSYKILREGYTKIEDGYTAVKESHRIIHERLAIWDGKDRRREGGD